MKLNATFATALLLASTQAAAVDVYAGIGAGISKADYGTEEVTAFDDGSFTSAEADNSDATVRVFMGADLTPNLGVEVAYADLGEISIGAVSNGTGPVYPAGTLEVTGEISALSLALKAQAPLNNGVSLLGKLGIARWDADIAGSFNGVLLATDSQSGSDPLIGMGVGFKLGDAVQLNLEATRYMDVGDYDTDVFGASLAFRFR